jgi:hypothetical protein
VTIEQQIDIGDLNKAYCHAWDDWTESGEAKIWDTVAADGICSDPAPVDPLTESDPIADHQPTAD